DAVAAPSGRDGLYWWQQPLTSAERLMLEAMAFVVLALAWKVATRPITDWDSLMFHLPVMAKWYQTGSFTMLEQFYHPESNSIQSTYPYNWESLCALFLMPFREDFLVTLPNLVVWGVLGLSVYLLSLQAGAIRPYALAATSFVLAVPMMVKHVHTLHVDLPLTAFFMAGVYWIVVYHRTHALPYLALFLMTVGMLIGIKTSGIIYGLFLAALLLLAQAKPLLRRRPLGDKWSKVHGQRSGKTVWIAVSVLGFLLLGSFWYARNWVTMGNPLGYIKVQLGPVTLFPGPIDLNEVRQNTTLLSLFQLTNPIHWKILISQARYQLGVPLLVMGCLAMGAGWAFVKGGRVVNRAALLSLGVLLFGTWFLYWSSPYSAKNPSDAAITAWMGQGFRYGFSFLAALGIAAAVGATVLQVQTHVLAVLVLVSSLLGLWDIVTESNLLYGGVVLLLGWGVIGKVARDAVAEPSRRDQLYWSMRKRTVLLLTVSAVVVTGATFLMRQKRDHQRGQIFGGVTRFIARHVDSSEVIGYVHSECSYLFYGKALDKKVVYVPAASDNRQQWLEQLQQRGVQVVAVGGRSSSLPESWKSVEDMNAALASNPAYRKAFKELVWLEDPDGPFVRVFGDNPSAEPLLYRFKK
ncbi:MAG: hypothetical protein NZT92_18150, partial [Abditibacteriales bacterium]|nr:hypothetical protein [Abditibacteriales bacterium]